MSEPEGFLTRWSRLKREADTAPDENNPAAAPPSDSDAAPADTGPESAVDLDSLPPLDSIGADTDLSLFMKPGVPPATRDAALRRAWASDPAIRDFRGPQENDWDFTASGGVPGFASFASAAEIRDLAARLLGGDAGAPSEAPPSATANDLQAESIERESPNPPDLDIGQSPSRAADVAAGDHEQRQAPRTESDVAAQHVMARRHGGALPQ